LEEHQSSAHRQEGGRSEKAIGSRALKHLQDPTEKLQTVRTLSIHNEWNAEKAKVLKKKTKGGRREARYKGGKGGGKISLGARVRSSTAMSEDLKEESAASAGVVAVTKEEFLKEAGSKQNQSRPGKGSRKKNLKENLTKREGRGGNK